MECVVEISGCFISGLGGGNSNIFHVHPDPWGNAPILTNIFQEVETTNQRMNV